MKVSQIQTKEICLHLREIPANLTKEELDLLEVFKTAAIKYCANFTGLTEEELDKHEDITIAVLCLISDMYENRGTTSTVSNTNKTVDTILSFHCKNFIPQVSK